MKRSSLLLFLLAAIAILAISCASVPVAKSPITGAYVRADYSSIGIAPSQQYASFKPGDMVHCSVQVRPGFRVEWYYEGKLRSKNEYFQFQPWKSSDLKLYTFDTAPGTSWAAADSVVWRFEVR
jgi:hypothetical protein